MDRHRGLTGASASGAPPSAPDTRAWAIGVDVGGTKILAGLVDGQGRLRDQVRLPTPASDAADLTRAVVSVVRRLEKRAQQAGVQVTAAGIGAAGFVDAECETVRFAPHLPWRDEPIRRTVAEQTGLTVALDNDANAAAWAEFRFGAGRGQPDLVLVTVGTGIGGGIIIGGAVQRGRFGMAAEFGHMTVVVDGRLCGCGRRGCWEQYVSGPALALAGTEQAAMAHAFRNLPGSGHSCAPGTEQAVLGPQVTAAAAAGQPWALAALAIVGRWLGLGLANLVSTLDPGCLVVGGGVGEAGELLLAPAREAYRAALPGPPGRPQAPVVSAALGSLAGVVGAADLARRCPPGHEGGAGPG